jgi:hypothetical protein
MMPNWFATLALLAWPIFALWLFKTRPLSVVLVLCKSMGVLNYSLLLVPLVRLAKPRRQLRFAVFLSTIALAYPMLRMADLVPSRLMLGWATSVGNERAGSPQTRFDQEALLLAKASERFLFGWGRFGRSRVYAADSGRDISITDGRWIMVVGAFGLFGFLAEFGLLVLPIFSVAAALRLAEPARDRVFLGALALILAINIFDLLPNSPLFPWTWLIAGALLGRAEALRAAVRPATKPSPILVKRTVGENDNAVWRPSRRC